MTRVRRWAMLISWFVVRHASAGAREWAAGVAREVEFVEGDWRALGWALGGLRWLFDSREAPVRSYFELSAAAEKLAATKRKASNGWKAMPIWVALYFVKSLGATSRMERSGDILLMLGWVLLATSLYVDWRSRVSVPPSEDVAGVIDFYKRESERLQDIHRSLRGWAIGLAVFFIGIGMPMIGPRAFGSVVDYFWAGVAALMWLGFGVGYFQVRRTNRRRLEHMDALLGRQS